MSTIDKIIMDYVDALAASEPGKVSAMDEESRVAIFMLRGIEVSLRSIANSLDAMHRDQRGL